MRRFVPVLLVALGIAAIAWLIYGSERTPMSPAEPGATPAVPQGREEPARAQLEAPARIREEAKVEASTALPSEAAPIALADPTEEELAEFARSVPPGTIEGIVLRGKVPVEGGRAWLGALSNGGLPWGRSSDWDAQPRVSRTEIGADGVFRFSALQPDTYGVGVRALDGATRHVYFELPADEPTLRIRIVLGSGGLRGRVFDERGVVCAGWKVAVYNYGNMLAGVQVIDGRDTDAAGAFEFSGLVAGTYILSAGPVADRRDPLTRTLHVQLLAGEWKTIDVGSPQREPQWSGRVLLPDGAALQLAALTELSIESGDVRETTTVTPQGTFQAEVASGTHRLALLAYARVGRERVELGEIRVPDTRGVQDVAVPRAVLRVRAIYQGTHKDPGTVVSGLSTWLTGADRQRTGLRGTDGHEYFLGLAPGEYQLSSQPPILGALGGNLPVRIREQDQVVELDIVIGDD